MAITNVVQVKNEQGVVLQELDVGWNSQIQLNLESLWEGIDSLVGTIRLNDTVVANLSKAANDKVAVVWVGETAGLVQVRNGDQLKVVFSTPITYTYTIPIKRIEPNWGNSINLAYIISVLTAAGLKGRTVNEVLNDGISKINASYAEPIFEYSKNTALNIQRLRKFFENSPTLTLTA